MTPLLIVASTLIYLSCLQQGELGGCEGDLAIVVVAVAAIRRDWDD